ncbi:MAG: glycosyltransferase [Candidatus Nanoarchaeia archaeon]|nr:glycosyltransferase [Candidatus Nanoarchaeia archaeon]
MEKKRNAIIAEAITNRGGVERQILTLLRYIDADIYTGIYDPEGAYEMFKNYNVNFFLGKKLPAILNTIYIRHKFKNLKLEGYDNYIFFGGHSTNCSAKHHKSIWYCNAPLRYLYDCYDEISQSMKFPKRTLFKIFSYFIRKSDQKAYKDIDIVLVNSRNVQKRFEKYFNSYRTEVLYAPVETKKFKFLGQKDYYLISSRLTPEKKVDLVVEAFQKMPDKKLIVTGDGPESKKIEEMSKNYSNINYKGNVSEEELHELYGNCIAVLYVTKNEDLGSVPLEAMSAGKPCIGANDGGMKESIIHKKTGMLISHNVNEVIDAVNYLTPKRCLEMKKDCEKRGKEFSEEKWAKKIIEHLR